MVFSRQRRHRPAIGVRVLLIATLGCALTEAPAHAYTDPGSGSLILQMVAATGVSALFFARRLFAALTARFKQRRGAAPRPPQE
jgi:hypothetical protein